MAKTACWHTAIEHFGALARWTLLGAELYVTLAGYIASQRTSKAEEIFRKALNADPNSRSALVYLAQLCSDQGTYDQAVELLRKIPESEMDVQTRSLLGLAYLQAGDFDNAAATYEKALAQAGESGRSPRLR